MSIAGEPDDQLVPLTRQRKRLETMLVRLGRDEWGAPSRCDDWTVQDVAAHIVGVNAFWTASVLAGLSGTPTRVLTGFDPAATPGLMVAAMRDLGSEEVLDQLVASNDALLGVVGDLDDSGWRTLAESPAGHVPIRLIAHHALWDCWIHERDIALALGLTPPAEADEVRSCLRYVGAVNATFAIASGHHFAPMLALEATDPALCLVLEVGESVAVRDGSGPGDAPCLRGDAVDLVEALSLRAPLPTTTPTDWLHLLEGLATAFSTG
jgi:uncharacterized protein (TIGR03083 family)